LSENGAAEPSGERARLVVITGLSGSGKSTVAKCFEDLGYFTVDNLPLPLLRNFLDNPVALVDGNRRIAVVTDVRAPRFAEEFPTLFADIDRRKIAPMLIFLEASDEALVRRFSETRRPHPLAQDGTVIQGIRRERELLGELRDRSEMILDTSEWSIHQVRSHIYRELAEVPEGYGTLTVSIVSFGFKHGIPYGTDMLFDVRYLANPHFIPGLREQTGLDRAVREYLEGHEDYLELVQRLADFLLYLLPLYRRENRSYLSVAIGCTGGKHRSVAISEALSARLEAESWAIRTIHRDLAR
jgi:RNase adapter protein RapZ